MGNKRDAARYPGKALAKLRRREYVRRLKEQPCSDCGKSFHWCVMEFDHTRGEPIYKGSRRRRLTFTALIGRSWKALLEEVDKCDIVCANCHKIRTFKGGKWYE